MSTLEDSVKQNTSKRKNFDFKDFSSLDRSEDAEYLITSMDELFAVDSIKFMKERAIDLLKIKTGESAIDLGCGLGKDVEFIGQLVGENGLVIGVDSSELMIAQAKMRSTAKQVQYFIGNANQLEYPDATFDACHLDRLLVSQKTPRQVFKESVRILKSDGRIAVTDCDFGSIIVHPYNPSTTPTLLNRLQNIVENPFIGRQLPSLFKEYGLVDITVIPEPYIIRSFNQLNTMIDFPRIIDDLYHMDQYTKIMADETLRSLQEADRTGDFLYGITLFTVFGRKP
jgi:ubiquinone/menaquinone biosynthesis C-methylase UbiE